MEAHQRDDTPGAGQGSGSATGRILVVDDEQQLLKVLTRYLSKVGYAVVPASSTEEAWQLVEAAPESFAVALIDATMEGMGAEELTRRLLEANPAIRVIASSGYPLTPEEFSPLDSTRVTFLHKPFSPDTLAEMLQTLVRG